MIREPSLLQTAASFDWETLIPIVFFVLYGIAQFLGTKKKGDPDEEDQPVDPDEDPIERARQIRDEIRRKIEESRQASGSGTSSGSKPAYDPTLPDSQQRQPVQRQSQPERPHERPKSIPLPRRQTAASMEPGTMQSAPQKTGPSGQDIEKRLREQQKRLAEARKRQQAAREQARKMEMKAGATPTRKLPAKRDAYTLVSTPSQLRNRLMKGLRDPDSLRAAVLYREILDKPKGLRVD